METKFHIRFSDLHIGFCADFPMAVASELRPFVISEGDSRENYRVRVLTEPMEPEGEELYSSRELRVFAKGKDRTFLFHARRDEQGLIPACKISSTGEHELWVSPRMAETLSEDHRLTGLLCIEQLLLLRRGLLLHSSVVFHEGKVILFSGPCGMGKSTQARLWEETLGASTLNGDRCVLTVEQGIVKGGGSPWCGSSGIYDPSWGPVEAIVLLRQGKENRMDLAPPTVAFRELYRQCLVHPWDSEFVNETCNIITDILSTIPVYTLSCLPDPSAVHLCYEKIFG